MMGSSLSSVVVATAMVDSVDTVVVAVVVSDVVMATEAVDVVGHEAGEVDPAAMLPRHRHRGRATIAKDAINCGGGGWVWTRFLKQAVA